MFLSSRFLNKKKSRSGRFAGDAWVLPIVRRILARFYFHPTTTSLSVHVVCPVGGLATGTGTVVSPAYLLIAGECHNPARNILLPGIKADAAE